MACAIASPLFWRTKRQELLQPHAPVIAYRTQDMYYKEEDTGSKMAVQGHTFRCLSSTGDSRRPMSRRGNRTLCDQATAKRHYSRRVFLHMRTCGLRTPLSLLSPELSAQAHTTHPPHLFYLRRTTLTTEDERPGLQQPSDGNIQDRACRIGLCTS